MSPLGTKDSVLRGDIRETALSHLDGEGAEADVYPPILSVMGCGLPQRAGPPDSWATLHTSQAHFHG